MTGYLHVCKFEGGWAFVPSTAPDRPRRSCFDERGVRTQNYKDRRSAVVAGGSFLESQGYDQIEIVDHNDGDLA